MWAQSYRTVFDFKMLKVKMNANKFTPIFYYRLRSWGLYYKINYELNEFGIVKGWRIRKE